MSRRVGGQMSVHSGGVQFTRSIVPTRFRSFAVLCPAPAATDRHETASAIRRPMNNNNTNTRQQTGPGPFGSAPFRPRRVPSGADRLQETDAYSDSRREKSTDTGAGDEKNRSAD